MPDTGSSPAQASTKASDRRDPLQCGSRLFSKHCSMGKDCSQKSYCISTVPGGHSGSGAGMTRFKR